MSTLNPILAGSAQSVEAYQQVIEQTSQAVVQWLKQPEMYQGKSVDELREHISLEFNEQGLGNQAAIDRAIEYFLKDSLSVHHPQCVAHLHCPSLVISQAAEVLINATNQSMDSWDQSPSATIIEMKLIEWLRARVGFPAGDAGVFTSGGTQSNLMGLMLARDAFFARQGHSIQQDGLPGDIREYKVLCSENAHFSVQKNMALMGLGYRSVTLVKTDEFARMDVSDLQAKIAQAQANGEQIMAIVATAGTTDAGAIDPLRDIAGIAAEHQIWLHVDAAWGGALLLSEQYRDYLDGLELVDSVTLDFHKQFFQTISCGAFLLKDARHYELMRYQAAYLNSEFDEEHGVPNLVSKSLPDHPSLRCAEAVDGSGSAGPETVCGNHRSRRHDGEKRGGVREVAADAGAGDAAAAGERAVPFPSGADGRERRGGYRAAQPARRRRPAGLRPR